MTFDVAVERGSDGYYFATCPSLKSCWSRGATREEAVRNIQEAIELYLEPSQLADSIRPLQTEE
jgi:predicted RNase H-like HicB family nuclease